jgi:hypothetical protein
MRAVSCKINVSTRHPAVARTRQHLSRLVHCPNTSERALRRRNRTFDLLPSIKAAMEPAGLPQQEVASLRAQLDNLHKVGLQSPYISAYCFSLSAVACHGRADTNV